MKEKYILYKVTQTVVWHILWSIGKEIIFMCTHNKLQHLEFYFIDGNGYWFKLRIYLGFADHNGYVHYYQLNYFILEQFELVRFK